MRETNNKMVIKNLKQLQQMKLGRNASSKIQSCLLPSLDKKSKYSNQKTTRIVNKETITFDSLKEAKYFDKLYLELKAGLIQELQLQPEFDIIPQTKHNGKTLCKIKYVADFSYKKDDKHYVIDVKGFKTDVYQIKKRLFLLNYPDAVLVEI